MSLYRQSARVARRSLVLGAVAALVAGLAGGFALGRGTAPDPSLSDRLAALREQLQPAQQGIELADTEYGQAVKDGHVVAPTEYAAAKADADRARAAFEAARADLVVLDPAGAGALGRSLTALSQAIAGRAAADAVGQRSADAARALAQVLPAPGNP
jgi:hypothetical protein